MERTPLSPQNVSLHFLGEEALLFDRESQRLYSANTTAAIIWCYLEEGMAPTQVRELLVERYGLTPEVAARYVEDLLRQWKTWEAPTETAKTHDLRIDRDESSEPVEPLEAGGMVRHYQLLDLVVTIRYAAPRLYRWVHRVLRHLTVPVPQTKTGPVLTLVALNDGYALVEDGQPIERCDTQKQVASMVKAHITYRSLKASSEFCALHAGAVRRGDRVLLLPGKSASGKSTLVAGLIAEGFQLLGDDTTVLTRDDLSARGVCAGVTVKSGAWSVIAVRYPRLARAPIHDRMDGQIIRYLLPPEYSIAPQETKLPVGWIVFPRYDAKEATALHPLSKSAALKRLMPCFVPLRGRLEPAEIERLVQWVQNIPCYELRVSSLNDAVNLMGHLCR